MRAGRMFTSGDLRPPDRLRETVVRRYFSLERQGLVMRLDREITPTRNRFATVSSREMKQLSRVKNILRKGRLRAVTGSSLVFLSGEEVGLESNTLVVDCAVNSTMFKPKTKIFQGDKIILQANINSLISFYFIFISELMISTVVHYAPSVW